VVENGGIDGFPGGEAIDTERLFALPVDVLVPAALENQVTVERAAQLKCSLIIEAANGPTTAEAESLLAERGVEIVPDILANAGGVTVSYFEWAQNIQQFRWEVERINDELSKIMRRAYAAVSATANEKALPLRTAAFVLAIRRVGQAVLSRRHISEDIGL
jgi:glutamate dehydrogenase (NAD(P)+)